MSIMRRNHKKIQIPVGISVEYIEFKTVFFIFYFLWGSDWQRLTAMGLN